MRLNPCGRGRESGLDRVVLSELRDALIAKRDELRRRTHDINIERVPEAQEQSAILMRNETSARQIERDRRTVRQIEEALHQMGTGEYGICLRCGQGIPEKRLRLVPWAEYCVRCQEAIEAADRLESEAMGFSDLPGDDERDRGPQRLPDRRDPVHPGRDRE